MKSLKKKLTPQFSVITVNLNNYIGLERTIKSVIEQKFKNYEFIIIDGDSIDESVEVIKEFENQITYWVSEKDKGIYHAMNKGIKASKGDYLLFLNSGDLLYDKDVLLNVSKYMEGRFDIYYGNEMIGDRLIVTPDELPFNFLYRSTIRHQATFIKRTLFDRVFYYNENLKIVSDWEFFIVAICKFFATYKHLDLIISDFDPKGISTGLINSRKVQEERKKSLKHHFSFIIDDYKELLEYRNFFSRKRFLLLKEIESYPLARRITTLYLMFIIKLLKLFKRS